MLDIAKFTGAMKQMYPGWMIQKLTYQNNPLYALMPKTTDFYGEVLKFALIHGNPQNRSNTFASAQAGTSDALVKGFLLTRKQNYSLASISNELMEASSSNEGAFLEASKLQIDGALASLARSWAIQQYRSGTGSIGKVTAVAPTTTLALTDVNSSVNFEVGQSISASTVDGGGAVKPAVTVTAIDRIAGTMTLSADVSGGGYLWAANDFIFCTGDYDSALSGLDAWLPYDNRAARTAASFYGVTRNVDTTRLAGLVYDASAQNYEEGLIDALNLGYREGAEFDYAMMNPLDVAQLVKILGSKVQRVQVSADVTEGGKVMAQIGFNAIEVYGSNGAVKVISDRNCPKGRGFLLQMDTWKMASLGEPVRLFEADGLKMLRSSNADALDIRTFGYANMGCTAPGKNMQIKLA
jgi:hypothetical protein